MQIEHQLEVVLEHRRGALWLLDRRQLEIALLLRLLDAPLDVTDRLGVLLDLGLVVRPQFASQRRQLVIHRVEQTLMLPQPRLARSPIGAAAVAEQRLEQGAWVPLGRERLGGAAPRERVRVDTAQVPGARPGVVWPVHRQLKRGDLRLVGEVPCEELVYRHVGEDLGFIPATPCGAGQERPGRPGMDVVPVGLQARQHDHLVPKRRQRLQNR